MSIVLLSPLTGWAAGLDETPDEAFAGGLLGDGVAVDPTEGTVRAPCDGAVVTVAAAGHAVAIRGAEGVEVLVHVGVDTVALKGAGFRLHVASGQTVRAGDTLLTFDLDRVAGGARSLISPVLVTNGDRFEITRRAGGPIRTGEALLELRARATAPTAMQAADAGDRVVLRFSAGLPDGVHARPAARIVAAALASGVAITVGARGRTASATSPLALMGLSIQRGDEITLSAAGPRAEAALEAVKAAFAPILVGAAVSPPEAGGTRRILAGTRGAPGLAIGDAFRHARAEVEPPASSQGAEAETRALDGAITEVGRRLAERIPDAPGPRGDILQAHGAFLVDPLLRDAANTLIAEGANAGTAWRGAIRRQADVFAALGDARLRDRRADLLDLERQVLAQLYGAGAAPPKPPAGSIILADELLPSELAAFAELSIAGVAMAGGGATSHAAIMAAALGLPMLTATSGVDAVPDGTPLVLDADGGRLLVAPDPARLAEMRDRRERRARRRAEALQAAAEPCVTADGRRIPVHANLGGVHEAERAVAEGAEGCGLLRSEFLFQDRASPPDEDEQRAAYQAVADRLDGRPLTVRTLDIGADKPAPYLSLPPSESPALGLRGVRVSLWRPALLRAQLRAILRVRGAVSVMAPMVASRHEVAEVRRLLVEEAAAMGVPAPPLGIMVETPAAALTVADLATEAAFFSLGTNDLAQYVLAMDRTLPLLASQLDGLHPAVVTLMRLTARAAAEHGRKLSVCGGLAADRAAIPLLIGLGVTELSLPPAEIAETKALIRTLSAAECRAFAEAGGVYADAQALRRALADRWPQTGDAA